MKIEALKYQNKYIQNHKNITFKAAPFDVSPPIQDTQKQLIEISNSYFPVNIQQNNTSQFVRKLYKLDNVHCPVCGVKMFSFNKFKNVLAEGSEITNSKDFIDWLESYQENIPIKNQNFIKFLKENYEKSQITDTKSFLEYCKEQSYKNSEIAFEKTVEFLKEAKEKYNLSDSDSVLLDEYEIRLKNFDVRNNDHIFKSLKNIFKDTILNMENENKYILNDELIQKYAPAILCQNIFYTSDRKNFSENSFQYQILENLFLKSFSNIIPLLPNYNQNYNPIYNKILCCQGCSSKIPNNKNLLYFYYYQKNLESNIIQYLEDIGKNILSDNLDGYSDYMIGLANLVSNITKNKINLRKFDHKNEIFKNVKIKQFYENLEKADFEPMNQENISCALCGDKTITHKQKMEIYEKINNAKTLKELIDLMNDNQKFINYRYRYFLRQINEILKNNPETTEEDIINICQKISAKNINDKLLMNIAFANLIQDSLSENDKAFVKNYVDSVNKTFLNLPNDKVFPYKEYSDMLMENINKIENPHFRHEYYQKFKEEIKKLYIVQTKFFPYQPVVEKNGSKIKVIIQNIFNSSTVTIKRIIPRKMNNSETKMNYMITCKNCNQEKLNFNKPKIKKHMQKYIDKLVELINNNELPEEYKDYVSRFCAFVRHISKEKIVLHYNFAKESINQ